ncbi:MAG: CHASE2 domain-containing protein, partial [Treponema sp.]|nr:CHASE2 domain-containing protein [Treponema sp.]
MSKPSALSISRLSSSLCCLGITFLLLFALWGGGFFSYFDTALYDFFLGLKVRHSPRPLNPQIVPIDLNDKTEMVLGERLNDRSAFGDLFSVLAHSRAQAALDFIYRGERDQDAVMLEAAARLPGLFVAVIPVPEGRENVSYRELSGEEKTLLRGHLWRPKEYGAGAVPRAGTFLMPFQEFGELATQLAHISIDPDSDGIYRRTPLFYAWEDGLVPSISLASALWELGVDGNDIEIHYGKKVVVPVGPGESVSIPIDSTGAAVVPFGGKWADTTHRYSFDILAGAL